MEGLFRNASSIHKTRTHLSSIKQREKPSEDILLPSEQQEQKISFLSSMRGLNDQGGPSFLEKRELEDIIYAALNGNLPIRELVDEEDRDRSVVIRLEETLTDIRRIHESSKIIRCTNPVEEEEDEDDQELDYLQQRVASESSIILKRKIVPNYN